MKLFCLSSVLWAFFNMTLVSARQYDENYLFEIIQSNQPNDVGYFFDNHPHYVKKTKHILEFIDLFRQELGKRYGCTPTWSEIYGAYKAAMPTLNIPQKEKDYIKDLLKEIVKKTEREEIGHARCNASSFDYRGSLNVDESVPEPVAIATSEALAGLLLCLVDNPVARGIGGWMITDSASKIVSYYTDVKSKDYVRQPHSVDREGVERDGDLGYDHDPSDHYDRLMDSDIR